MPPGGQWVVDPDSGGVRIPEAVRRRTEERLRRHAAQHFAGRYARLAVRFRGQICDVDAFTEPEPQGPDWPPPDWPEARAEYLDRLRDTPTRLCRLRYFCDEERWGFAFDTYGNERYDLAMFPRASSAADPRRRSRPRRCTCASANVRGRGQT